MYIIEQFIFHLFQNYIMNYNHANRNSLISCIYSDRPSYPYNQPNEPWKNVANEQHLNPSKSKVNVRQSLNKTAQNCSTPNPTILNIRNSCLVNTSISTHNPPKDTFLYDKFFKNPKDNQEQLTSTLTPKDNYPRYSQVSQPRPTEERKKSQSAHFRSGSSNQFIFKLDNQFRAFQFEKSQKIEKPQKTPLSDTLRDMINALTKRVATNEEQIAKLKDKSEKDKKFSALQSQLNQYKSKIFELSKFNSSKIQQNSLAIGEIKEKIMHHPQKDNNHLQNRLKELNEIIKVQLQNIEKKFSSQTSNLQININKSINEELTACKICLQSNKKEISEIYNKIKRIQCGKTQQYKKSNKKSNSFLTIQSKQSLIIRQSDLFKDRTKQFINYPQSSKKQAFDQIPKRDTFDTPKKQPMESKRELIIKQKFYYIDTNGFLLDQNKYYLLNNKNQQILLSDNLINCLKQNNLLSGVGFRR